MNLSNIITRVTRLITRKRPSTSTDPEIEHQEPGRSQLSSTVMDAQAEQQPRMMGISMAVDENLNMFRLLVGITSHPSMGPNFKHPAGHRPAANLGIYARVVHNELTAKTGYKRMSILINSCLGLQIIVAASLVALGASNSSHGAVTAFGAVNTVIAGILTFLKGSGLPNRMKYYQNEWKKIREYIEQRERDFSRPNCGLNPYDVVATVEAMYQEVKLDTEANTPERFAGSGGLRNMATTKPAGTIEHPKSEVMSSDKLKSLEAGFAHNTYAKDLEAGLGQRVHDVEERFGSTEKDLEAGIDRRVRDVEEGLRSREKNMEVGVSERIHSAESDLGEKTQEIQSSLGHKVKELELFGNRLKDIASEIGIKAKDAAKEAEVHKSSVVREAENAVREAESAAESAAEHLDSSQEEEEGDVDLKGKVDRFIIIIGARPPSLIIHASYCKSNQLHLNTYSSQANYLLCTSDPPLALAPLPCPSNASLILELCVFRDALSMFRTDMAAASPQTSQSSSTGSPSVITQEAPNLLGALAVLLVGGLALPGVDCLEEMRFGLPRKEDWCVRAVWWEAIVEVEAFCREES
ncbi:hypothetical protein LOCC1_G002077 [Lachnellula occidentalis]|uniref:SMODS and SLOG-associating 2TM effector domain-containing protein n=1 Tax=Lachnellula occidentalis TaxID=215460 RepID=A0A8H8S9C6_9HELO|nr:hypothetical protein LOCC1_G002077 [Lachnellula occidentalis]